MPPMPVTPPSDVNLDNLPQAVQGARLKARSWSEPSGSMEGYFQGLVDIDERLARIKRALDVPTNDDRR